MSIPVEAMHSIVREDFLGAAEKIIEKDDVIFAIGPARLPC